MQKDPGQAGESVVTLQRSGPAEPGRGGVSSGLMGDKGVAEEEGGGGLHRAAHVGLRRRRRRRWWEGTEVKRSSN